MLSKALLRAFAVLNPKLLERRPTVLYPELRSRLAGTAAPLGMHESNQRRANWNRRAFLGGGLSLSSAAALAIPKAANHRGRVGGNTAGSNPLTTPASLATSSFADTTPAGTTLSAINGIYPGATVTTSDSRFTISGSQLKRGAGAWVDGPSTVQITQTFGGFSRTDTVSVTIYGAPASGSISLLPNQRQALDLTPYLAGFSDVGNEVMISVTGTAGPFKANVHNARSIIGAGSALYVQRELLDYFWVQTVGATLGDQWTVTLQGHTGPNGTGSVQTQTITFACALPTTLVTDIGVQTLALCGGQDLCAIFGGNATDWTIQSQSTANRLTLVRDSTANTCRLVPRGTTNTSSDYGSATLKVPLVAGQTDTLTVANASLGVSYPATVTYVASRADVAPHPNASTTLETGTTTITVADFIDATWFNGQQASRALSMSGKNYGMEIWCEDGSYTDLQAKFVNGTANNGLYVGAAIGDAFSKGIPTAGMPFTDGWDVNHATRTPVIHHAYVKFTSRNPWAAIFASMRINIGCLVRNQNPNWEAAFRVSGFQCLGLFQVQDMGNRFSQTLDLTATIVDHNYLAGLSTVGQFNKMGGVKTAPMGNHAIANFIAGPGIAGASFGHYGMDSVQLLNRFTRAGYMAANAGINNDLVNYDLWDSDYNTAKSIRAFNFYAGKQGDILDGVHEDYDQGMAQPTAGGWFSYGQSYRWARQIGDVIWGAPYALDGSGRAVSGGQMNFTGDPAANGSAFTYTILGCIGCELTQYAAGMNNVGNGSSFSRNTFIADRSATNPASFTTPQMRLNAGTIFTGSITNNVLHMATGAGAGGNYLNPSPAPSYVLFASDGTVIPPGTYISQQLTEDTNPGTGQPYGTGAQGTYQLVTPDGSTINTTASTTITCMAYDDRGWAASGYRNLSSAPGWWNQPNAGYMVWSEGNNLWNYDSTDVTQGMATVLVNPYAGATVMDMADAIRACTPKAGAANYDFGAVNPHIDQRRCIYDEAALRAA